MNGRQFLMEQVELPDVKAELDKLSLQSSVTPRRTKTMFAGLDVPAPRPGPDSEKPMEIAQAWQETSGFVMDYLQMNASLTNFTFQSDLTYYVSGRVDLWGTTTFEGGAVIKCAVANGLYLVISDSSKSTIQCNTSPDRPVIFTSRDDDSVGSIIADSSGAPSPSGLTNNLFLTVWAVNGFNLHDMRMLYAHSPMWVFGSTGVMANIQVLHSYYPLWCIGANLKLRNWLLHDTRAVGFWLHTATNHVEHLTVDQCGPLAVNEWSSTMALTNCLLVGVQSLGNMPMTTDSVANVGSIPAVFQAVGVGGHYLVADSPYRDAGTANIDPVLLASLQQMTTYPPPESYVDADTLDLGFHYPRTTDWDVDGMEDGWEWFYFSTLTRKGDGDFDEDQLTDLQEFQLGTNPTEDDSDSDGMPDGWEWTNFGNFAETAEGDADDDGLSNKLEYQTDGNPNSVDTDADELPDDWELKHFGNLAETGTGHYDGDQENNRQEFLATTDPNDISFGISAAQAHVNGNTASLTINLAGGMPFEIALAVNGVTNNWQTYATTSISVPLNSGDGDYAISIGLRGHAPQATEVWRGTAVTRDTAAPMLQVLNPTPGGTVSNPISQIKGSASEPVAMVSYDLVNTSGTVTGQPAFVTRQQIDATLFKFTVNDFQAYDVRLAAGANTFTVHAVDLAGNEATSTFTVTLDETLDHTAPTVAVTWPAEGANVAGETVTLVGTLNDDTATVVVNKGGSSYAGTVFRGGRFSVSGIPLSAGANSLTVTAKDAANNSQSVTRVVNKAAFTVTVSALTIAEGNGGLFHGSIACGVSTAGKQVLVNGVLATQQDDTYTADNFPISNNGEGGPVLIQVYPDGADPNTTTPDAEFLTVEELSPVVQVAGYLSETTSVSISPWGQSTWAWTTDWQLGVGGNWSYDYLGRYGEEEHDAISLSPFDFPATDWRYASSSYRESFVDQVGNGGVVGGYYEFNDSGSTQTGVELVTHGAVGEGDQLIRLRMTANIADENAEDDGTPIAPSKMKIQGKQATAAADDPNVGEVYITVAAGSKPDIATSITGINSYTFDVKAETINARMLVDANRDGVIDNKDAGQNSATQPFRFWVNDDDDPMGSDIGGIDIPQAFSPDSTGETQGFVDGARDLVDFFPVFLNVNELLRFLPHDQVGHTVKYKLKHADGAINFAYTGILQSQALDYQRQILSTGFGDSFSQSPKLAATHRITATGYDLSSTFLNGVRDSDWGVILLEGRDTTVTPLVLAIEKDEATIVELKLSIRLRGVETMFRHLNLRDGTDMPQDLPVKVSKSGGAGLPSQMGNPSAFPDSLSNGSWLVFVHGYNVGAQDSRGWESELFKRFYWSGNKARFIGVDWLGNPDGEDIPADYHQAVMNALPTAGKLAGKLNALSGTKTIVGHSMGCMVAAYAISDFALQVNQACLLNAAVASECFDGSSAEDITYMAYPPWTKTDDSSTPNYPRELWASDWHKRFLSGTDARQTLTWKDRYSNALPVVHNFFSSTEDVLGVRPGTLLENLGTSTLGLFMPLAWQIQEKAKGNEVALFGASAAGSDYGGWGFNIHDGMSPLFPVWYVVREMDQGKRRYMTPAEIAARTNDWLNGSRWNPLFNSGWGDYTIGQPLQRHVDASKRTGPDWIVDLYDPDLGIPIAADPLKRNQLLAEAIPALSPPAGNQPILDAEGGNYAMPLLFVTSETLWPREPDEFNNTQWFHSDLRAVAYLHTFKLFDKIISISNQ